MSRVATGLKFLAWMVGLAALTLVVARRLDVDSDLRLFLPTAKTPQQRLLLDAIGEGPASRLLVVTLEGAPIETLAAASSALVEQLDDSEHFRLVANGEVGIDLLPDDLLPYRYLLSPDDAERVLEEDRLRTALATRMRDLASPGGFALEPLIARDPTLLLLTLLEQWEPAREPRRELGVWFDSLGVRALLVAETRVAAFDPTGQRAALAALNAAFAAVDPPEGAALTASGAGAFSVLMETRTRAMAEQLARWATIGMLLLLVVAYRHVGALLLASLPLASAAVAGLAAVSGLFGSVHGITLAFGFTLIGVAQDYPLHLLSHRRPGIEPVRIAVRLWPTLATGVASTCVAYLTFWFSGVTGLAQLACFTVTGLVVAALSTRYLLPQLMVVGAHDFGESTPLRRLSAGIDALPRLRWALPVLGIACVGGLAAAPQPFWENDLGVLTPVPSDLLRRDQELRTELTTADTRHFLVVEAATRDAALVALESLAPELDRLTAEGAVGSYDHAARYVPSAATQRARQAQLRGEAELRAELEAAVRSTSFRTAAFEPFLADVERARSMPPLTIEQARAMPVFSTRLDTLLTNAGGTVAAFVTFSDVRDAAALAALAERSGATLLDVKTASEELVAEQRSRMLASLSVGFLLLVAIVAFALRDARRVQRVLAPLVFTTLIVVALLQVAGVSLNLFHLISLILAAGLGLDYALFFERAAGDLAEHARTLHAVLTCATATLMVFVLLAIADLPVLRSIGVPVAIGVVSNFVLALLLTRSGQTERGATS